MVRIVRILSCAAVAAAIWLSALQLDLAPAQRVAVLLLPIVCVAALGTYLLGALVYGLATFRTCPEELQALQKDIALARVELAARGVTVDPTAGR